MIPISCSSLQLFLELQTHMYSHLVYNSTWRCYADVQLYLSNSEQIFPILCSCRICSTPAFRKLGVTPDCSYCTMSYSPHFNNSTSFIQEKLNTTIVPDSSSFLLIKRICIKVHHTCCGHLLTSVPSAPLPHPHCFLYTITPICPIPIFTEHIYSSFQNSPFISYRLCRYAINTPTILNWLLCVGKGFLKMSVFSYLDPLGPNYII